jgi:hypothetical protein
MHAKFLHIGRHLVGSDSVHNLALDVMFVADDVCKLRDSELTTGFNRVVYPYYKQRITFPASTTRRQTQTVDQWRRYSPVSYNI